MASVSYKIIRSKKHKDLDKLTKKFKSLHKQYTEIGYFNGETHPEAEMSFASLAAIQEYGTGDGHVPARYTFNMVAVDRNPKYDQPIRKIISRGLRDISKNKNTADFLAEVGMFYQKELRGIMGDKSRLMENDPITIRLKGHDSPMIGGGDMKANVGYRTSKRKKIIK